LFGSDAMFAWETLLELGKLGVVWGLPWGYNIHMILTNSNVTRGNTIFFKHKNM